jgi:predicted acyltransferase
MGVLQRIAIAYGIAVVLCMSVRRDYLWIVVALILLAYWGLLGIFGGDNPYSLDGNFALKVDRTILGPGHLYRGFGIPFDPEGLLSTITAVCTVITGYYAGGIIGKGPAGYRTALRLLLIGVALTGLGLLWGRFFPINKPLWTSSYVLYTAGIGLALFSFIYWITDVAGFRIWGAFFTVFGVNALFSFFLSGIWTRVLQLVRIPAGENKISLYTWIYEKIFVSLAGNMNGSLAFAIVQMLIIWSLALILYRKKVMIKL